MNFLKWTKELLSINANKEDVQPELHYKPKIVEPPPLNLYEVRRKEIEDSTEQVEGIFYLYDNRIIPDYYSECLISDVGSPLRKQMYHMYFYPNYMRRRFGRLHGYKETSIPRGRVEDNLLFIDPCYEHDFEVIQQIYELYRLPKNPIIICSNEYRCMTCSKP